MFVADTEKKIGLFVTNCVRSVMAGRKFKWIFHSKQPQSDSGATNGVSHCPLHCAALRSPEQLELQNHESHENYSLTWKLLIMQQAHWPPAEKKVEGQIFGSEGKDLIKRRLRIPKGEDKRKRADVVITSWTSVILRLPP